MGTIDLIGTMIFCDESIQRGRTVDWMHSLFNEVQQVDNGCDLSQIIASEVYIIEIIIEILK